MRNLILRLRWTNGVVLTVLLMISVPAHSQPPSKSSFPALDPSLAQAAFFPAISTTQVTTRDTRKAIFVFHTDEFWLNLHHFLYVLGRAENKERDTAREAVSGAPADQALGFEKLTAKEQEIWREAVVAYAAGPSKKDVVFDEPMPALTNALARAGDAKSLDRIGSRSGNCGDSSARRANLPEGVVEETSRGKSQLAKVYSSTGR